MGISHSPVLEPHVSDGLFRLSHIDGSGQQAGNRVVSEPYPELEWTFEAHLSLNSCRSRVLFAFAGLYNIWRYMLLLFLCSHNADPTAYVYVYIYIYVYTYVYIYIYLVHIYLYMPPCLCIHGERQREKERKRETEVVKKDNCKEFSIQWPSVSVELPPAIKYMRWSCESNLKQKVSWNNT